MLVGGQDFLPTFCVILFNTMFADIVVFDLAILTIAYLTKLVVAAVVMNHRFNSSQTTFPLCV